MNYVRSNPDYLKMLRKSTLGTVNLWLDASWAGWDRFFDYIFCVAKPFPSQPSQYIHVGFGADPRYLYPEQKEKAVFLDSLMWGKYHGKYDKIYKLYEEVLDELDIKVYTPVPVYNKTKRLPWAEMQEIRRKCHFFLVTQLGGFGLGRIEAATCGSLIVQPKSLYRRHLSIDVETEIWSTRKDLIKILEAPVDVGAIRKKALEHTWDKAADRMISILENNMYQDRVIIGKNVRIQEGTVLGALPLMLGQEDGRRFRMECKGNLVIEDDVDIGANSVLNLGWQEDTIVRKGVYIGHLSSIGHDADIGEHTVISVHVCIAGHVKVGKWCYIAPQTVIEPHVKIGDYTMIGMGSVVKEDIPSGVVAYGTPCKVVRDNPWRPS